MFSINDTILNLGLNDDAVEKIAEITGNRRFAFEIYREFLQLYGQIVFEVETCRYEDIVNTSLNECGVSCEEKMTLSAFETMVKIIQQVAPVPNDPKGFV